MEKEKFKLKKGEEIVKARIPDKDMPGWIKTLREGGFSDEEIDLILSRLNKTYKEKSNPNWVEDELTELKRYFRKQYNRILTPQEIEYLKRGIKSREE